MMYVVLAGGLIWLGIGSINLKRWARALLLITSWSWLVIGITTTVSMAIFLPKVYAQAGASAANAQPAPSSVVIAMMIFMMIFMGVFFVIVPGIFTFFYSSRHVKATCEARDPAACWTDACPLPVLAASLWVAFGTVILLIMVCSLRVVVPFFGTFLTGAPGVALYILAAAISGYGAWALYKLNRWGWWLLFLALCGYFVSSLLTFARHDVMEMYRLMDYSDAQMQQLEKFNFFGGQRMMWLMVFSATPCLGYFVYIYKFFRRDTQVN
jgi:hypothetical protein